MIHSHNGIPIYIWMKIMSGFIVLLVLLTENVPLCIHICILYP